jgi:peptide methionine sulfoxide reductase MsrB
MFIAVYEFEIKEGTETSFRAAWFDVTKAIYKNCGSFGSRLHTSDKSNVLVGYAQWPSRDQWDKINDLVDGAYQSARNEMRSCLVQSKTIYELEVCDDYLQTTIASE